MPHTEPFHREPAAADRGTRRECLIRGVAGAAACLAPASSSAQSHESTRRAPPTDTRPAANASQHPEHVGATAQNHPSPSRFSRFRPSYGGPPGSPDYLGKLVPGLRQPGLAPVAVTAPDLHPGAWRMVDGAKEFEITCEPVQREFLPGYKMDVWGYDGSMPGPTLEATQGDRVRLIVHNKLPEDTTVHFHGIEMPVAHDGIPYVTQDPIRPGQTHVYEFDLHQAGTFFYHPHYAMQEAFGMVGLFIVHPRIAHEPTVDRDFALCFQNFFIPPNSTIPDSARMDWNWHTINGRSGPYATPLVCKHGERVRVRILDFSPMQHHPVHLHGHTFWVTGTEGGRIPDTAWIPGNNTLVGVAMVKEIEFVANNIGDWMLHCHMTHHMMNHMVSPVGPTMRPEHTVDAYLSSLDRPPPVPMRKDDPRSSTPGYPQEMMHMGHNADSMREILGRREVRGMRAGWHMGVMGLMTVLRVLPPELYDLVMESDDPIEPGISVPGSGAGHAHRHG